jgi:hypothetical protein
MVNFRGFLRNLPLNTELMRDFLAEHLFDTEDVLDWSTDEPALAESLADAIETHPDPTVRNDLIAAIEQVAQLADGAGSRQMMGCAAPVQRPQMHSRIWSRQKKGHFGSM